MSEALPVYTHPVVGPITTIRDDGLELDARDLGDLLATQDPRTLDAVAQGHESIRHIPRVPGLILRMNDSSDESLEIAPEETIPLMVKAEREFERLRILGARMLKRSVYVVGHDPYAANQPVAYTIVERHEIDSLEPVITNLDLRYRPDIQQQLLHIADVHTNYYAGMPPRDERVLSDLSFAQHAQDGLVLDYDPRTRTGLKIRLQGLESVIGWAEDLIAPSDGLDVLIDKIDSLHQGLIHDMFDKR